MNVKTLKRLKITASAVLLAGLFTLSASIIYFGKTTAAAANFKENERMKGLILPTEQQYDYKDWKQTTIDYLNYMLDDGNTYSASNGDKGGYMDEIRTKKIGRYTTAGNVNTYFSETGNQTWGIPSYIGSALSDSESGEGINVLAAVMSGGLVGLDMTSHTSGSKTDFNYVKGAVDYYQAGGDKVVLNKGQGAATGTTFWYELLPGVLFSVIAAQFPTEQSYTYDIVTESARSWYKAVVGMGGASADFRHTAYKLSTNEVFDGSWTEPDAAAGMAYILYSAYSLNKDIPGTYASVAEIEQFRQGAVWSMNYLEKINFSPFYEVLTFLAPYLAARMNAELQTNYNVAKMLAWTLDGSSAVRGGWGMVTENWGSAYTSGLMGSLTDGGGYAFAMNTFDAMMGFAPMVKYDTRFAQDIAKWVLCVSQSARQYYPEMYTNDGVVNTYYGKEVWNGNNQSGKWITQTDPKAEFIPYEGLRKSQRKVVYTSSGGRTTAWNTAFQPYASGDSYTFNWNGHTDYGLYGASHVGLFGATIRETNVSRIIETDLDALDIFNNTGGIRFRMYFNPYTTAKNVTVDVASGGNKLYDTIEKQFMTTVSGGANALSFNLSAGQTAILAEIPSGKTVTKSGSTYTCDGTFIAQERGSVDMTLYKTGTNDKISDGANVDGIIDAALTVSVPDGATVTSVEIICGGATVYGAATAPSGRVSINTASLKNGNMDITARLVLAGGAEEKSIVSVRILNVVKTPALEYENDADMAAKWNAATTDVRENWTGAGTTAADHIAVASVASGGGVNITIPQGYAFGFATSEEFYVDFSRGPMMDISITAVTQSYAVKFWAEGNTNLTGEYLIRDDQKTGEFTFALLDKLKEELPLFNPIGAMRVRITICPVGGPGDSVTVNSLNVYHMYGSPNLEEPSSYEWGFKFPSVWLSLWNANAASGGLNDPQFTYNNRGEIIITAAAVRAGIAGPFIAADITQNPVIEISPLSVTGSYFVGARFEGSDTLYILAENQNGAEPNIIRITDALRAKYPAFSIPASANIQIVVGAEAGGTLTLGSVDTYYKLPEWGTTVKNDAWLDWDKQSGQSVNAEMTFDASRRAIITNVAAASLQTAAAGYSGKFTVNFDYNPELSIL
ncbi:MAG: hypothetical protein LBS99_02035, partial [Clostridiales bacterium]|nr:hypothetical protein [Clostridiales bacterium]